MNRDRNAVNPLALPVLWPLGAVEPNGAGPRPERTSALARLVAVWRRVRAAFETLRAWARGAFAY